MDAQIIWMTSVDIFSLSDILFNIENILPELMDAYGLWIYIILFAIIFCETGLVFVPFLPGDTLLFLLGFFAARWESSICGFSSSSSRLLRLQVIR